MQLQKIVIKEVEKNMIKMRIRKKIAKIRMKRMKMIEIIVIINVIGVENMDILRRSVGNYTQSYLIRKRDSIKLN